MVMRKLLVKANCRTDNYCVFCEHWLGKPADVNHINGESKIYADKGLCSQNNEYYSPEGLCKYFKRRLLYM